MMTMMIRERGQNVPEQANQRRGVGSQPHVYEGLHYLLLQ